MEEKDLQQEIGALEAEGFISNSGCHICSGEDGGDVTDGPQD